MKTFIATIILLYFGLIFTSTHWQPLFEDTRPLPAAVKLLARGGHGSGTYIGDGFILTVGHASVKKDEMFTVEFMDQFHTRVPARVVYDNDDYDVALLKIQNKRILPQIRVRRLAKKDIIAGHRIMVRGNPFPFDDQVFFGRATRNVVFSPYVTGKMKLPVLIWQTMDMHGSKGISGAGIQDAETGELVGIFSMTANMTPGLSIMIPVSGIKAAMCAKSKLLKTPIDPIDECEPTNYNKDS